MIDLDAIQLRYINNAKGVVYPTKEQVRDMMKEAIHQALKVASENAEAYIRFVDYDDAIAIIDKQSILDVEKLIV